MATKTKSRSHGIVRYSTPKPIVIRQTKIQKPKHHRRRGGGGHGSGTLMNKTRMGIVAGAFAVGILEKQGIMSSLPTLPFVGRTGTIGIAAYLLSNGGRNKLADEVCTAALVVAAHELASTGSIVGAEGGQPDIGYVAGW
jgi:hypothetical protein